MLTTSYSAHFKHSFSSRQRGVGLIEVLVTMLVLAIGVLGMAGLQNTSIRLNYNAALESQAQFLAYDLLERMRISREINTYVIDFGEEPTAAVDCTVVPNYDSDTDSFTEPDECEDPVVLAVWDLNEWLDQVEALPSGQGKVEISNPVEREVSVTIRYDDQRGASTGADAEGLRELTVVSRL